MSRLDTEFGDDGLKPGQPCKVGGLQAFGALYKFAGRTWSITVWAHTWEDAERYCADHSLKLDGQIEEVLS